MWRDPVEVCRSCARFTRGGLTTLLVLLCALVASSIACSFESPLSLPPGNLSYESERPEPRYDRDVNAMGFNEIRDEAPVVLEELREARELLETVWPADDEILQGVRDAQERLQFAVDNYPGRANQGGYISAFRGAVLTLQQVNPHYELGYKLKNGPGLVDELIAQAGTRVPDDNPLRNEALTAAGNLRISLGRYPDHPDAVWRVKQDYDAAVEALGKVNQFQADHGYGFPYQYPEWNATNWDFSSP